MEYPLTLSFKVLTLASQFSVTDARGQLVYYVRQKLLKLKEEVTVFADTDQQQPLYQINADRVLDISARYHFSDPQGIRLGSVKREGLRSLWRAHYNIEGGPGPLTIREENPWLKVLDTLFGSIPILGMFSGYVFHPAFLVSRSDGAVVMRLQKQPAFFESKFTLEKRDELDQDEETRILLSLIMMILLERARG
jgi:hypothetical protein